jgi:hypothetical protein
MIASLTFNLDFDTVPLLSVDNELNACQMLFDTFFISVAILVFILRFTIVRCLLLDEIWRVLF